MTTSNKLERRKSALFFHRLTMEQKSFTKIGNRVRDLFRDYCLGISCYSRLEGEEGVLESPNYPSDYPSNQDCNYDIVRTSSSVCGIRLYSTLMVTDEFFISSFTE